ncbi:MAG TPA: hypothetical protein VMB05_13870 [Solirubrobacteraceae bacterium]|nr:hypothetical protein [Solirubrobacteraceae bacterium]
MMLIDPSNATLTGWIRGDTGLGAAIWSRFCVAVVALSLLVTTRSVV